MTTVYRPVRADEERTVLQLWSEVYATAYDDQVARFASDPAARAHTLVAVAPDGAVLSALHYLISRRWDAAGIARAVGEIDSVTTRPEARRQGHAARLLQLALAALRRDGCDWSLLVATPTGRALYEREGWRGFAEPWRRGTVPGALPPADGRYRVWPYDPAREPGGWDPLAAVDLAFNRQRPLAVARSLDHWRTFAALRVGTWMRDEGLVIFAAARADGARPLCGYALAEFYPPGFQVRDLGALPTEPGAALALLAAVAAEAQRRGIPPTGRCYLPREPAIDDALARLFGPTLGAGEDRGQLLARTVAAGFSDEQLVGTFAAPRAHFSAIDLF